ncbi:MAG: hypothetical protein PHQ23_09340 [Candidatus Wallbacteria bacterium]|nr:hypothetical protein [Candidatus Wallbacteria bacterium]
MKWKINCLLVCLLLSVFTASASEADCGTIRFAIREIRPLSAEINAGVALTGKVLQTQDWTTETTTSLMKAALVPMQGIQGLISRLNTLSGLSSAASVATLSGKIAENLKPCLALCSEILACTAIGNPHQNGNLEKARSALASLEISLTPPLAELETLAGESRRHVLTALGAEAEKQLKAQEFPMQYNMLYIRKLNEKMDEIAAVDPFGTTEVERLTKAAEHALDTAIDSAEYTVNEAYFLSSSDDFAQLADAILKCFCKSKNLLGTLADVLHTPDILSSTESLKLIKDSYQAYSSGISSAPDQMETLLKSIR